MNRPDVLIRLQTHMIDAAIDKMDDLMAALDDAQGVILKMMEALQRIEGGFIDTNFTAGDPVDWREAYLKLQAIAREALRGRPYEEESAGG